MIDSSSLKKICEKYGINYEKLVTTNPNILEYGEYNNICYVLDYLRDEVRISPSNIEKCPSVLYFNIHNIRSNYEFLKKEQITNYSVEGCLHILSTDPLELRKTYQYIIENYGVRYLNARTTILRVPVERIQEIEIKFPDLKKKNVLQAACSKFSAEEIEKIVEVCKANGIEIIGSVFLKSAEEIEKIVEVCKANGIEPTGTVFHKMAEEIEKIVEVCQANGIEPTGTVFQKSAEEIEKTVEVCKANGIEPTGNVFLKPAEEIKKTVEVCKTNGIEPTGTVFLKSAGEIEKIVEVCKTNGIEPTGTVFQKSAKQLQENIDYISENYGEEYLTPLIVSKNLKNLKNVLPYLQEIGVLKVLPQSSSILTLTLEEIKEREGFIESIGQSIISQDGSKFNSIFGLSKKRYAKRVEQEKNKGVEL